MSYYYFQARRNILGQWGICPHLFLADTSILLPSDYAHQISTLVPTNVMGDDMGSGLSSMAVCFDFRSTNIVQLIYRNPYFYWFRCHHPLITQLSPHLIQKCSDRPWPEYFKRGESAMKFASHQDQHLTLFQIAKWRSCSKL